MLRPRSTPIVTEVETNRQLLIWDALFLRKLETSYQGLSGFDVQHVYERSMAVCSRFLHRDPVLLNTALANKSQILKLLNHPTDQLKTPAAVVLSEIENILKESTAPESDTYWVQQKKLKITRTPVYGKPYPLPVNTKTINDVSVFEFEDMAFNNRTVKRLCENTSFATYFYHNALHAFGGDADGGHADDRPWQMRLASLIEHTDFSERATVDAFYDNKIVHNSNTYDTSFVPKFNVRDLNNDDDDDDDDDGHRAAAVTNAAGTDQARSGGGVGGSGDLSGLRCDTDRASGHARRFIEPVCVNKKCTGYYPTTTTTGGDDSRKTDTQLLEYRNGLNVRTTDRVPLECLRLFLTFPFKDGHVVDQRSGKIHFMDNVVVRRRRPRGSVNHALPEHLRSASTAVAVENFNEIIYEFSVTFTFDELLSCIAYTDDLDVQGMGLIVMRAMVGDTVAVSTNLSVRLPYANEVQRWLKNSHRTRTYSRTTPRDDDSPTDDGTGVVQRSVRLLFPHRPKPHATDVTRSLAADYVRLVRDITRAARSRFDCAILCSGYTILETLYAAVYAELKTDAEVYVFLTIVVQDCCGLRVAYREYRSTLHPSWPISNKLSADELYKKHPHNVRQMVAADDNNNLTRPPLNTGGLVRPVDTLSVFGDGNTAVPTRETLNNYEYCDPSLRSLVETGTVQLTADQIVGWLVVTLSKK
ncbi:hypothetical protein AGLY_017553 [Aphis glycines]|uniref:Uncharacterized protein n=1 Tax=Aphis glycines TaxID=307491 RepID=A0A6G0SUJ5_APHGL|nr:hypothetical protein AGLY_017553 [Aphis glycines]